MLISELNRTIAFAVATKKESDINKNAKVPFDIEVTNKGGAYDMSNHKFTCPITGYYYFAYSHLSTNDRADLALYMDGAVLVGKMYSDQSKMYAFTLKLLVV